MFYSDGKKIEKILLNLTGNAVKFTKYGKVEIEICGDNKVFECFVRDTGIGISDEKRTRLFEPFDQGEDQMTKKYSGTGLGLVIAKKRYRV